MAAIKVCTTEYICLDVQCLSVRGVCKCGESSRARCSCSINCGGEPLCTGNPNAHLSLLVSPCFPVGWRIEAGITYWNHPARVAQVLIKLLIYCVFEGGPRALRGLWQGLHNSFLRHRGRPLARNTSKGAIFWKWGPHAWGTWYLVKFLVHLRWMLS